MKMLRTDDERKLKDPALTALLQEAFADDPALEEAPGRTDRIMRRILTQGVRPATTWWAPWAWGAGAVAMAAMVMLLVLGGVPTTSNVARWPLPAPRQVAPAPTPPQATPTPVPETPALAAQPPQAVPTPQDIARGTWKPQPEMPAPVAPETPVAVARTEAPTEVARALYSAGSTAQEMGDYALAYEAYQASYDAMPTPDSLMAASAALMKVASDDLEPEG